MDIGLRLFHDCHVKHRPDVSAFSKQISRRINGFHHFLSNLHLRQLYGVISPTISPSVIRLLHRWWSVSGHWSTAEGYGISERLMYFMQICHPLANQYESGLGALPVSADFVQYK